MLATAPPNWARRGPRPAMRSAWRALAGDGPPCWSSTERRYVWSKQKHREITYGRAENRDSAASPVLKTPRNHIRHTHLAFALILGLKVQPAVASAWRFTRSAWTFASCFKSQAAERSAIDEPEDWARSLQAAPDSRSGCPRPSAASSRIAAGLNELYSRCGQLSSLDAPCSASVAGRNVSSASAWAGPRIRPRAALLGRPSRGGAGAGADCLGERLGVGLSGCEPLDPPRGVHPKALAAPPPALGLAARAVGAVGARAQHSELRLEPLAAVRSA
eukprot:SAG11_NODE_3303_length_2537_cov_4.486464_2_plen_274_part_01